MQMQADLANIPVQRPVCVETTALGAAYLAGLAVGYWDNLDDIRRNFRLDRIYEPDITDEELARKLRGWRKAVKYSFGYAREDDYE